MEGNGLEWVHRSKITLARSDFEHADALLDPAYPEHVGNLMNTPFYYYVTSFAKPQRHDPDSHVSAVFTFAEPVRLCGVRIRGENYSDMEHMPKCLKIYQQSDSEGGPQGNLWTEVACFEPKCQRGWQMFVSQDVQVNEPQQLSDSANHLLVRGERAQDVPAWNVGADSATFKLHNSVDCQLTTWNVRNPALHYRLDVVDSHGGYIALAEINFLVVNDIIVQLSVVELSLECRALSGDLICTLESVPTEVSELVRLLRDRIERPARFILPDGRMLSDIGGSLEFLFTTDSEAVEGEN